jgi:hypothetical protein
MAQDKPVSAYATHTGTGWAATDKHGRTWSVNADTAANIEADRSNRNENKGNPHSLAVSTC